MVARVRSGKPSNTAIFIAFNRTLGTLARQVPGFSDPMPAEFLPDNWKAKIRKTAAALAAHPKRSPFPFWLRGMGLFNQFRTVVLDRAIASAGPIEQLVILGAGLDTRAWRLDALAGATVFEVDHPSTQALKRQRAEGKPAKAREVRFVATDFHEDDMTQSLLAADYNPSRPAFWLWEGVTMYQRADAVAANLDEPAQAGDLGRKQRRAAGERRFDRAPRSVSSGGMLASRPGHGAILYVHQEQQSTGAA